MKWSRIKLFPSHSMLQFVLAPDLVRQVSRDGFATLFRPQPTNYAEPLVSLRR
jgi:hypothetical protein